MIWKRISPRVWKPTGEGEVLEGVYRGLASRGAVDGQWSVALIERDGDADKIEVYSVGGVRLVALLQTSIVAIGERVRITFTGHETTLNGYEAKTFEIEVLR